MTSGTSALILAIWFSVFCLFCHGIRLVGLTKYSVLSQRLMLVKKCCMHKYVDGSYHFYLLSSRFIFLFAFSIGPVAIKAVSHFIVISLLDLRKSFTGLLVFPYTNIQQSKLL